MLMGALGRLRKIYAAEQDKEVVCCLKETISGLEESIKILSDNAF